MSMNERVSNDGQQEPITPTPDPGSQEHGTSSRKSETPLTEAQKAQKVTELLAGLTDGDDDGRTAGEDGGLGEDNQRADAQAGQSGGEGTGEEGQEVGEGQTDGGVQKPKTLTEAAERLGMKPSDLYNLTITTGDGEEVKIGDMKDVYQNRQAAERESAERSAALDQRETAIVAEQRVWGEIGDDLSKVLTPQVRAQLESRLAQNEQAERRKLLDAMPEMADQQAFTKFRTDAVELLGKYGYQPHQVVISDHRQLVLLRDMLRLQKRLDELKSFKPGNPVPKTAAVNGRRKVSNTDAVISKARNSRHEADKIAGVAALLKGS